VPFVSVSFDDPDEAPLYVFSGRHLLIGHYDQVDLDWEEVAERTAIDERRGLVITQVAVLEDLLDEFILYLEDPVKIDRLREDLAAQTIGPRITRLEDLLRLHDLLDASGTGIIRELRRLVSLRNRLAHGTIDRQPTRIVPVREWSTTTIELEWVLVDRRSRTFERLSMAALRKALVDAQSCFFEMLRFAETLVERAPVPRNFTGGWYLDAPTL
jgi:hypothetical protein